MTAELMTETEKKRQELHKRICAEYKAVHERNPEASVHRICAHIASAMDMSVPGVRSIVTRYGIATPRPTSRTLKRKKK